MNKDGKGKKLFLGVNIVLSVALISFVVYALYFSTKLIPLILSGLHYPNDYVRFANILIIISLLGALWMIGRYMYKWIKEYKSESKKNG